MTELEPGVSRIAVKGGGASIIVTRGVGPDRAEGNLAAEDAAIIALAAPQSPRAALPIPVSVLRRSS